MLWEDKYRIEYNSLTCKWEMFRGNKVVATFPHNESVIAENTIVYLNEWREKGNNG